jgi:beta-phosphoglucomutase
MRTGLILPVCPDYSVGEPVFSSLDSAAKVLGPHVILIAVNEAAKRQIAMIFDLDGVLVHSMPLHVLAWEHYLRKLGVHVDDLERRMHGKRNAELVRDLVGNQLTDDVVFEHGASKERLFREMLGTDPNRYRVPGVFDFLKQHRDVPKAVASNAEPANIEFVLDQFDLAQFFEVRIDGFQVSRPKPFPDIYYKAAEELHTEPKNCIVFEDSPTGLQAGRSAGMRVVGVETTPAELGAVDLHIQDFLDPQLEPWIQGQRAL